MSGKTSPSAPQSKTSTPTSAHSNPARAADTPPLQPPKKHGAPSQETIRVRAYALWEQAGHPECDGVEFWLRAEQELSSTR
jgi:hypothetical protein